MKNKIKFIIPSLITLVILLIMFYYQGLYPFTNHSIVQVDADYQFIPVLYRIYDFLHGSGNILYDDIGLGNNIYISMIIQGSIFSPLTLLLYFTSRDNLVNYFNIIVIVKFCLLSLTSYIYINKSYKVNEYYKIMFSVLYTFSGWVLLNYFNIMWLDSVILFPLIIMYLDKLLNKGKYFGYVITLSMSLMISYYVSYYILLFILFYSFVYIFIKLAKNKMKSVIFKLGISTVIAILISSFSLLPALYQTFNSSRIGSFSSSGLFSNFMNKSLFIMLSTVFLIIFIFLMFKYKKDKKNIYCYSILMILFSIGLFIEPINLAIHMGSYWSFPYRYSFITLFILMGGSLYYLEKYDFNGYKNYQKIRFILFLLFGILLIYLNSVFYSGIVDSQIVLDFDNFNVYKDILLIFLILVLMIILVFTFNNKLLKYISFSIVCLIQIFVYSGWTMYYSDGYYLSTNSNDININMNLVDSELGRYKMGYFNYTPDHGFIYDVNTLDNWLHILPENEISVYRRLGYKNTDTCVRSYGGTIFTDWLFNVKYLLDNEFYDNEVYELIDSYDGYYLYEYNYDSGFGFIYNKDMDDEYYRYLNNFDLHNSIYRELFDSDSDIVKIDEFVYDVVENKSKFIYNIDELGYLYLNTFYDFDYINVNGEYIDNDDSGYIIDLGAYSDDVEIEIGIDDIEYFSVSLGFIKYEDMVNLSSNVDNVIKVDNGYDIEVNNNMDNGYLFLPINNISGLRAYVNGNSVNIDNYADNFVSIKLDSGLNNIKIRYDVPFLKLGFILSFVGVLCLILFGKITTNKMVLNVTYYIYIIVCLIFYLYFYAYSFVKYYNY